MFLSDSSKIMTRKLNDRIIMLRFGQKKVAKQRCYDKNKPIKTSDVDVDNIVISKLIETTKNSKNLIGLVDDVIRPLVLVLPKIRGYVKNSKYTQIKMQNCRGVKVKI